MDLMGISARHRASRFMEFKCGHRAFSEGDFRVHMNPSWCRKRLKAKRRDPACQPRRDSVIQPWHLLFWVQEMLSQKKNVADIFIFSFTLESGSLNCQDVSQKRELDTRSDLLKPVSHVALHLTAIQTSLISGWVRNRNTKSWLWGWREVSKGLRARQWRTCHPPSGPMST